MVIGEHASWPSGLISINGTRKCSVITELGLISINGTRKRNVVTEFDLKNWLAIQLHILCSYTGLFGFKEVGSVISHFHCPSKHRKKKM